MHTTKYLRMSSSANDQKLCIKFWICAVSFYLWLDDIHSKFKSHLKLKCTKKQTADKYILITSRFIDRKFTKFVRIFIDCNILFRENVNQFCHFIFSQTTKNGTWIKCLNKSASWNEVQVGFINLPWQYCFVLLMFFL